MSVIAITSVDQSSPSLNANIRMQVSMFEIMQIEGLLPRFNFPWRKSLGIWLSVWAIRYKADWDYKLGDAAKAVRWGVVGIGYVLAASLPGPGIVRVMPGAAGLCFLCWPNLAYHLTNLFVEWPTTEGKYFPSRNRTRIGSSVTVSNCVERHSVAPQG